MTGWDCPLCGSDAPVLRGEVEGRRYLECPRCRLVFLDPAARLDADAERARYETHENDPADSRYRGFLDRLAAPLVERLSPGAEGLDFGSGPGPTLSVMLEERGFPMRIYDPFFAPDSSALDRTYDFITCTETIEHLYRPGAEFERLASLLRPGGFFAVMTQVLEPDTDFAEWWYRRDPTHVAFYPRETLQWIADHFGWSWDRPHPNVAIYRSRGSDA